MRAEPRWLAVLAVVAIAAVVCAFTVRHALTPDTLVLKLSDATIPADGFTATQLTIHSSNGRDLRGLEIQVQNQHGYPVESTISGAPPFSRSERVGVVSITINQDSATVLLRAGVLPGDAKLRVAAPGFTAQEITLQTTLDAGDAIGDGTPDFLRLHDPADRAAFRRWFTLLAESQYYRSKAVPEIDDCAALLRFAYREALREHDAVWARSMSLPAPASAVDVEQYQYPYTPLAASLFRVRGGAFQIGDLSDGAFAQFADVDTIRRYNTFYVGRDFSRARPGDLLFFRQDGPKMPFHAMIFLGRSQVEPGNQPFVIYHTGPSWEFAWRNSSLLGF